MARKWQKRGLLGVASEDTNGDMPEETYDRYFPALKGRIGSVRSRR
jgi:hypothetical protein